MYCQVEKRGEGEGRRIGIIPFLARDDSAVGQDNKNRTEQSRAQYSR